MANKSCIPKKKIIKILMGIYIGDYVIIDGIIEEIETSDGKKENFINDKTTKWDLSTNIILKNTDTINDLEQQLSTSDFNNDRISFHGEIERIKNTIFSYFNLPINIKKITCNVRLEKIL